jgi:hypothetical protein
LELVVEGGDVQNKKFLGKRIKTLIANPLIFVVKNFFERTYRWSTKAES